MKTINTTKFTKHLLYRSHSSKMFFISHLILSLLDMAASFTGEYWGTVRLSNLLGITELEGDKAGIQL